jgi:hypothetical protein
MQERALLAFEVLSIPRKPAASAGERKRKEEQLAVLDRKIGGLTPASPLTRRHDC